MPTNLVPVAGLPAAALILFLLKATLLLLAALVGTTWLRHATAGARHLVWLAALAAVLALPVLSRMDAFHIRVLPSGLATALGEPADVRATAPEPPAAIAVAAPTVAAPVMTPPRVSTPPMPAAVQPVVAEVTASVMVNAVNEPLSPAANAVPTTTSLVTILLALWAAVALGLVGWLVAGAMSVRRIVSGARELVTPDWTMPLCEVADRLDLEVPPRLVLSDRIEMAFACRAAAPTVVLPAAAESWTDDRRRAVLFHELAHVKRHDLIGHTLGRLACALYWFHPLVWSAARHLRAESERACDDLVLQCGARPSDYAQHLLDMVTSVRRHGAPVMALPMARKKEFEGRMLAILDPAVSRGAIGRLQSAMVILVVGILALTIAGVAPASAHEDTSVVAPSVVASAPAARAARAAPARALTASVTPAPAPRRLAAARAPAPVPSMAPARGTGAEALDVSRPVTVFTNQVSSEITRVATSMVTSLFTGRRVAGATVLDTGRVALLLHILSTDNDASVRRAAAWALHDVPTAGARTALSKALQSDADASVREMSAWSLSEFDDDDVAPVLAGALAHDRSAKVRTTSAWALGQRDHQTELAALEGAVSDSSDEVRRAAIWAIGNADLHTAPPKLATALHDRSKDVRLVAAWALGRSEDASTTQAIASAFMSETDPEVRSAELRALAVRGDVPTTVLDVALHSSKTDVRRRAVAMLAGGTGGPWPWPWPWPQPRPMP